VNVCKLHAIIYCNAVCLASEVGTHIAAKFQLDVQVIGGRVSVGIVLKL